MASSTAKGSTTTATNAPKTGSGSPEIPTFLLNFLQVLEKTMSYQRRAASQPVVKQNLLDNVKKIADFKVKWCMFAVDSIKEKYQEVRQRITDELEKLVARIRQMETELNANLGLEEFFPKLAATIKDLAYACCTVHILCSLAYVECIEQDLKFASRSLSLCRESISSKAKLVETFELATVIFARLAESCSLMAVQQTTPEDTANALNEYFESLNNLNVAFANQINEFTASGGDEESMAAKLVLRSIHQLQGIMEEVAGTISHERASITPAELFEYFARRCDEIEEHMKMTKATYEEEVKQIEEHGAKKRLERYVKKTGNSVEPAVEKLAVTSDQIGIALEGIYYVLNNEGAELDLKEVVQKAQPHLKYLPEAAVQILSKKRRDSKNMDEYEKNLSLLAEMDNEISISVQRANDELLSAANELLIRGDDIARDELLTACMTVEDVVDFSASIIPAADEDSRPPSPFEEPAAPNTMNLMDAYYQLKNVRKTGATATTTAGGAAAAAASAGAVGAAGAKNKVNPDLYSAFVPQRRAPGIQPRRNIEGERVQSAVDYIEGKLSELEKTPEFLKVEKKQGSQEMAPEDPTTAAVSAVSSLPDGHIWRETRQMKFEKIDGRYVPKAGSLNQLVIHLTSPLDNAEDALAGSDFFLTFMLTLQTFTEPETFVRKMIERYMVPPVPEGIKSLKNFELDVKYPVQMRVCNVLKKWIIGRYDQDLAHKPQLIEELFEFINDTVVRDSEYLSKNLRQCLTLYISGERFLYHQRLAAGDDSFASWGRASRKQNDAIPLLESLAHMDARELARQLTLIHSEMFRAIRLYELAGQAWSKPDAKTKAPNLTKLIDHTNEMSVWVAHSILSEPKLRRRRKVLANMIMLCYYLKTLKNYHGVMGILAGISTAGIARLKYTNKELSSRIRKILSEIETEMSSMGSFHTYRDNLKKTTTACIPFIGVMLSDLTFIEDGNPDLVDGTLINWSKRSLLYSILSEFLERQRVGYYTFPDKPLKEALLASIESVKVTPQELYEISLKLEPRGELPVELAEKPNLSSQFQKLKEKTQSTVLRRRGSLIPA